MARFACPVCGDPSAYPMWMDDRPPEGCPSEPRLRKGQGICAIQLDNAKRAANWRRTAPECFDNQGNMLPGKLGEVLRKVCP